VTNITQRASVIHKDILTQTEVLFIFQTTSPQDREALDEWVKMHDDGEQRYRLMESLAKLPKGTAWVWSPAWLRFFDKVRIRGKRTSDSSRTPTVDL
jgi:hypothetical protein